MLKQPRVEAAYFDWAVWVERITVARSLPDPRLTFESDIQDIVMTAMPGFMMNFPAPGKLRAGGEIAAAESQSRYSAFRAQVLESAYEVKRTFYQFYFLTEKTRVNQETLALLADLEKLARAQSEVGKVTLQDVLRAEIEQDRLSTERRPTWKTPGPGGWPSGKRRWVSVLTIPLHPCPKRSNRPRSSLLQTNCSAPFSPPARA